MIVLFQIIFCALTNLFKLALFKNEKEYDGCNNEGYESNSRQEPTEKGIKKYDNQIGINSNCVDSSCFDSSCEVMYLEALSSKNPLVSKEFLKHLEQKSTQLASHSCKCEKSEEEKATITEESNDSTTLGKPYYFGKFNELIPFNDSNLLYTDCPAQEEADNQPQMLSRLNNCLSDRDWLDEFQHLFTTNSKEDLKIMLCKAFSESKDPYLFALYIMSNAECDFFSGKKSLTHIMLTEFESWLEEHTAGKSDNELQKIGLKLMQEHQDSALEIVATSKLFLFEPIKRIFKLDCRNNGFLEKHIRYLLHTGNRYKEAATFAYKLNLQTQFEPSEILLPLLILDKLQLAESYVMSCPWQQRAYLTMLDRLCGTNDDELQEIVDSANIHPKPKENKLKNKILVKIAERLVKKFNLNGEDFPNVYKEKNINGLRYLLYKKYTEKNKSLKKWDQLIESAIGNNYWLQQRLIEGLVDYGDLDEAVRWTNYYKLPLEDIPFVVQERKREWNDAEEYDEEENWELTDQDNSQVIVDSTVQHLDETRINLTYQFPLPSEKIIFVDDEWSLTECLSAITRKGSVVGFDAEWRPTMCRAECSDRLAIIQLATWTEVYILDMIALMKNVSSEQLQYFAQEVFSNSQVLKLGYGCESDFQVITVSCLPFKVPLSQVKRFVDLCPLSKQVFGLPQIKKKISAIREKKELKRFEMERGLSELVMLCLGKPLDKTYQVSNWEGRPLLPEQMTYAALDAYCLLEVYSVLQNWVQESAVAVNMEPDMHLPSLGPADGKKRSRNSSRSKNPKPGSLGKTMCQPVRTGKPIAIRSLSVVVDTMLQGLGRQLRCCGADVKILSTGTSHEEAAKIAREENRILLTSGTPYYTMRSQVPEGMCMCVPAGTAKDQVAKVLRHFNVRVKTKDIFSRCQICNGNQYIKVLPGHMKAAYLIMVNGNYDALQHVHFPQESPIDFETLTLRATGVKLKLCLLHDEVWSRKIDLFFCCATCGKVFWEGSHFRNVMAQFSHVLDDVDKELQPRTVYSS